MAVRSERSFAKKHNSLADADVPALGNTSLAQLRTVDIKSREFTETLAKMLSSQDDVNAAMSLQSDDALTLVDILDQVSRRRVTGAFCLT